MFLELTAGRRTLLSSPRGAGARSRPTGSRDRAAGKPANARALRRSRPAFRRPAPGCSARRDDLDRAARPAEGAAALLPAAPLLPARCPDCISTDLFAGLI